MRPAVRKAPEPRCAQLRASSPCCSLHYLQTAHLHTLEPWGTSKPHTCTHWSPGTLSIANPMLIDATLLRAGWPADEPSFHAAGRTAVTGGSLS